jgi:ornithine cyclodeaminase/alanine dehydrogenase-like protein (mu-crystallin family)
MGDTLILTRSDIAALMTPGDYLDAVRAAFMGLASGRAEQPAPLHISADGGGFHAKGARLVLDDGRAFAAVKVNGNFPDNPARRGLPTIQGAVILSDAATGEVLALMDSIEVTLRRTAAATALALKHLARADATTVGLVGCGGQALAQLAAVAAVQRPNKVLVFDLDQSARERCAASARHELGLDVTPVADLAAASLPSNIVVCCTTATAAFLEPAHIRPGTFIAAVGADAPHKSEIAPELMARAKVVVDSADQCAVMGDLRHALNAGAMRADDVHAALADIVAGRAAGRTDADEVTIFDSTGLAVQDVAAAAVIHARARAAGCGLSVQLA